MKNELIVVVRGILGEILIKPYKMYSDKHIKYQTRKFMSDDFSLLSDTDREIIIADIKYVL